jgi:hypothetical protein
MADLWSSDDPRDWQRALEAYAGVIERQGVPRLPELDRWYRSELPEAIATRQPAWISHGELVRVTEWKMARGVWRQRNLILVRSNEPMAVEDTSRAAFSRIPDSAGPIATLAKLAGVGPATASAVAAAAAPDVYPFLDELVANQIPGLGPVDFAMKYYGRYADALRYRTRQLGGGWSVTAVERALWANVGGKAGIAAVKTTA